MQTRSDMESELVSRLMVAANSSLFPAARITALIQDAYMWATSLFVWQELVRGRQTNPIIGQDYYDYPNDFRTGTIIRLEYDGNPYKRKNWEDFTDYKKNNPTSIKRIFANFGRQYFLFPGPTTATVNGLKIWGAIQAPQLASGSDKSIFSLNNDDANEAIVDKAESVALKRIDVAQSTLLQNNATGTLTNFYGLQQLKLQRDQRVQHPQFDVPDFFGTGGSAVQPGSFSVDPDPWNE